MADLGGYWCRRPEFILSLMLKQGDGHEENSWYL